jgi:hypothetical protein
VRGGAATVPSLLGTVTGRRVNHNLEVHSHGGLVARVRRWSRDLEVHVPSRLKFGGGTRWRGRDDVLVRGRSVDSNGGPGDCGRVALQLNGIGPQTTGIGVEVLGAKGV